MTSTPAGLSSVEAARRLAADGPNAVGGEAARHWLGILAGQFRSPLVLVLIAAAAISRLLGQGVEAGVILLIVGINAILGFVQEFRADHAVRALRRLVTPMARVSRDGSIRVIPAAELVRGDLVSLEVGDLVPADLQLVAADDLSADEAALTGESAPVSKAVGDRVSLGSAVASGYCSGVVVATGRATVLGRTAHLLEVKPEATDFERACAASATSWCSSFSA